MTSLTEQSIAPDLMRSACGLVGKLVGDRNTISISRTILKLLEGDYPSAVLLCQAIYWNGIVAEGKGGTKDGYFWKSYPEWQEETCLSEYQIRQATKRLEKMRLLKTCLRVAPRKKDSKQEGRQPKDNAPWVPTVHYQVCGDNLFELLLSEVSSESIPQKLKNPSRRNFRNLISKNTNQRLPPKTTTTPLPPDDPPATAAGGGGDPDLEEDYIRLVATPAAETKNKPGAYLASIRQRISQSGLSPDDLLDLDKARRQEQPPPDQPEERPHVSYI